MKYFTSLLMSLAVSVTAFAATDLQPAHSLEAEAQQSAAAAEPVELVFHEYAANWKHDAKAGEWYCTLKAPDAYTIYLDIYASDLAGEYTTADFNLAECMCLKYKPTGGYDFFTFTEGTLKVAIGVDGFEMVDATLTTSLDETLHIVVVPESNEPKEFDIEASYVESAEYFQEDKDWLISFGDADYQVYLDLINSANPGSFAGTYGKADCVDQYTYITKLSNGKKYYFDEIEVITQGEEPLEACAIKGKGKLDNGDVVTFHLGVIEDTPSENPETPGTDPEIPGTDPERPSVSIESVTVDTQLAGKLLQGGRLLLRHAGAEYNVFGQRVK